MNSPPLSALLSPHPWDEELAQHAFQGPFQLANYYYFFLTLTSLRGNWEHLGYLSRMDEWRWIPD